MTNRRRRETRRELAYDWAMTRQALKTVRGNYVASAVLRNFLRLIERCYAGVKFQ